MFFALLSLIAVGAYSKKAPVKPPQKSPAVDPFYRLPMLKTLGATYFHGEMTLTLKEINVEQVEYEMFFRCSGNGRNQSTLRRVADESGWVIMLSFKH